MSTGRLQGHVIKGYNQNKRLLGLQESALERLQKTMSMGFGQDRRELIINRVFLIDE